MISRTSAWTEAVSGYRRWFFRIAAGAPLSVMVCAVVGASTAAADSDECPATPAERQRHARPLLAAGERPWAMAPLPVKTPAAPKIELPPPQSEERRRWVRRFTFVLTGLPPREDDAGAFLADASPRALDKVLDRLLADAATPQRLTEIWLRTTGYVDRWPDAGEEAVVQPVTEAWRYRDWAVASLRSTPDPRALARLTLAGDTRSGGTPGTADRSSLVATLWHLTSTRVTRDFEQTVVEWSGRQAERTARTFLGIDLACARCHDHPALPLPSEEAAGLVAIFAHSHAFARGPDGTPVLNRVSTIPNASLKKNQQSLKAIAAEESKLEEKRREFALLAASEFLPQTAEYVRAAWQWHRQPTGSLASFSAGRGLLAEPLGRWLQTLGLEGEPPTHSLTTPWWAEWTTARTAGTPEAITAAARTIQDLHRIDSDSPFFSTSPAMDAFFTLDQQTQIARQVEKIAALRGKLPRDQNLPGLAEGFPPGMEPPALSPSLPSLLTGGQAPTPVTPPGAGRRALATWLEGEGATFFARLAAVRLAEGLGHPLLPPPSHLQLWSASRPPEADTVDEVAACLMSGGWPAAAKRILLLQSKALSSPPLTLGGTEWRDAVLFVAGTLDPKQGGPPDRSPDSPRRSLYREWSPFPSIPDTSFLESQSAALAALARRKGGADPKVQLTYLTHRLFLRGPLTSELTALENARDDLAAFCATLLQSEEFRTFP